MTCDGVTLPLSPIMNVAIPHRSVGIKVVCENRVLKLDMKDLQSVYRSALVGISTDGKIEHMKVTAKAINQKFNLC